MGSPGVHAVEDVTNWGDDEKYRIVEVPAEYVYHLIEGTYLGQASPKSAMYTYEDVYEFLAEFDSKTKIRLRNGEGILLERKIYIPTGESAELYERWLLEFNSGRPSEEDGYIRIYHD